MIQASEKEEIELFEEALKQKNNKLEQIEELNKEISEISTKEKNIRMKRDMVRENIRKIKRKTGHITNTEQGICT